MDTYQSPSGGVLLKRLKAMEGKGTKGLSLMLVSLSALPTASAGEDFWNDLDDALTDYKNRYDAQLFEISKPDRALLIKISELGEVAIISDLKVAILRLIQNYFSEHFGCFAHRVCDAIHLFIHGHIGRISIPNRRPTFGGPLQRGTGCEQRLRATT